MIVTLLEPLLKIVLLLAALMTACAYLVLVERWMAAWVQDRLGPNRVGIPLTRVRLFGLGQPLADGIKLLTKAQITPSHVDKALFIVAPMAIFVAALAAFAVIPFGSVIPTEGLPAAWRLPKQISLVVAPGMDVGMVYVYAVGSVAVYGVVLGGWASNDKYSFLGGMRSSAQLISYELPLGLGILGVVLATGSLRLDAIIHQQAASGAWNVFTQPLGFVVFCVAGFAEAARLPFDLPEAEQELVGGYHTEYSGIKLVMYMVAEFLHMITASFLIVILFLGGWHLWGVTGAGNEVSWPIALVRIIVLLGKVMVVILFFMLARWSWPRFRFDQLMDIGWKVMIPWGLVNVVAIAAWIEFGGRLSAVVGLSPIVAMALGNGCVLILCWLATVVADPTSIDNRPRRALPVVGQVGQPRPGGNPPCGKTTDRVL
ncbi:MAG: NADH-quinone oxidoreductase subunit NuoH [Planctomycetaceae bacterium]|nr:NADH-quinone oxidoreductase subunit NuoH [Planctomycetaceae bacterium]